MPDVLFGAAAFFIALAVIAGGLLPVQGVVNSQLGRVLDDVILAALISFVIGTLTLLMIYLGRHNWNGSVGLQGVLQAPPTLYIGGALGAFYVTMIAILMPKIGVANTMIAIIFGQIVLSILLDHIGFLGMQVREINGLRLLGASLVFGGMILVVKN